MTTVNVDRQIVLYENETQGLYLRVRDVDNFSIITLGLSTWLTKAEVQAIIAKISAAIEGP